MKTERSRPPGMRDPSRTRRSVLVAALAPSAGVMSMLLASPTRARRRLDDRGTHTVPPNVAMQWRPLMAGGGAASARQMEAQLTLHVRIDTRDYAGRLGRIDMVMPPDAGSTLQVRWVSRGRALPGRMASGERALMYQGVMPNESFEDQLHMHLMTDGAWMTDSRRLELYFEMDQP